MTLTTLMPQLYSSDEAMEQVDWLRDSSPLLGDMDALRQRMSEEGYLFLPGLLHRDEVLDARREVAERLAAGGFLDAKYPAMDAVAAVGKGNSFMPEVLAKDNQPLMKVLYDGPMIEFFQTFLAEPVRHYDYTWFRSIPPGRGSASHCDIVYMGRGERERLFTAWTPIGDTDFQQGGLMVLEGSNRHEKLKSTYGQMDVDSYCENKPDAKAWGKTWGTGGWLKGSPNQIRRSIGGRWLSSEYRAGDVLIFSMFTIHASLDNRSNRVRLSSDSRYQPASAPADERWIGPNPSAHGAREKKRGRIC
jgi:hypothetical protein